MRHSRCLALLLALLLALTLLSGTALAAPILISPAPQRTDWLVPKAETYDGRFADAAGVWCEAAVETVYEAGLMEGKTADRFDPYGSLTRAQSTVIIARLLSLLTGGDGVFAAPAEDEVWYQPHYNFLSQRLDAPPFGADFGTGGAMAWTADTPCQRGAFALLLCAALKAAEISLPVLNDIAPPPDVSNADIFSLYQYGVLNGYDSRGTFNSGGTLTRGAAAAMLARLVDPAQRLTFTLDSFDQCRDVLGLAPETVVLTANGVSVTAEQFSNHLCEGLYKQYTQLILSGPDASDPHKAMADAISALKRDLALAHLAEEAGITVARQELTLPLAGYRGMTEEGLRWQAHHALLEEKLLAHYTALHGAGSLGSSPHAVPWAQEVLDGDLMRLVEHTAVEPSPELEALDLVAAYERLIASP